MVNIRKAAMIGCGFVGSSSAFALMQSGIFSEMVMIDVNREKAEGEAMDIAHGLPFARPIGCMPERTMTLSMRRLSSLRRGQIRSRTRRGLISSTKMWKFIKQSSRKSQSETARACFLSFQIQWIFSLTQR